MNTGQARSIIVQALRQYTWLEEVSIRSYLSHRGRLEWSEMRAIINDCCDIIERSPPPTEDWPVYHFVDRSQAWGYRLRAGYNPQDL